MREPPVVGTPSTVITSLIASGMPGQRGQVGQCRPAARRRCCVGLGGLLQGHLGRQRQVGLDVVVDGVDAVEHGPGQLDGRDLAGAQQGGGFMDGQFVQHVAFRNHGCRPGQPSAASRIAFTRK